MTARLEGRLGLITGGSRGIGASMAKAFASEGAKVVIVSRKAEPLEKAAAQINERFPGMVLAKACHVGRSSAIDELFQWLKSEVGTPDILVNNAATNPYFGPMLETPEVLWDKTFEVNLKGYFEMTRRVLQPLLQEGRSGSVINVASVAGLCASPLQGVYAMTKAAVISMTKTLAAELAESGIRVNAIAPGLVETRLASALIDDPDLSRMYTDRAMMHRPGQPDEIAGMAVYLASNEASFVTGQVMCVDGGFSNA